MEESFFVDLPNFYSRLIGNSRKHPKDIREYFVDWLDFDRIARALSTAPESIWIYYAGGKLGPSGDSRIAKDYLEDYISRINRLPGVTARDVNIPGEQREPILHKCEQCGKESQSEWVSEKGIDSSLTVSMFETMDSWNKAFLFSGDADFVPIVAALRRMGKIVIGVGFEDASPALIRECYEYIDIWGLFLQKDYAAFSIFQDGGLGDVLFSDPVEARPVTGKDITLYLIALRSPSGFLLGHKGPLDTTRLENSFEQFDAEFPGFMEIGSGAYYFKKSPLEWEGIERRLDFLLKKYEQTTLAEDYIQPGLERVLHFNPDTNEYSAISDSELSD